MKDKPVRVGVTLEASLVRELDAMVRERGCTRSELFRELARAAVGRAKVFPAHDDGYLHEHPVPGRRPRWPGRR